MKTSLKLTFFGAVFLSSAAARADVKLPALFTDNMVLQRDTGIPIFGSADAGESVTVRLGATNIGRTRAGADGKWLVRLAPQSMATGLTLSVTGKNALVFKNVALGEVWLASGQSNMEWPMANVTNAQAEIAAADFPAIRLFTVTKNAIATPQSDVRGKWEVCTPATVRDFSAIAYFYGRELHQKLNVPIGLIDSTWGGTVAEAWTSREAIERVPTLQPILATNEKALADYPAQLERYQKETLPAWETAVAAAKAEGKPEPRKPDVPRGANSQNRVATLYNGMIAPLVPYGIKGVIWYQGESNAGRAEEYRTLFPTLISDWRSRFGQGDFPFYWVQLANYQGVQKQPAEGGWAMVREAQNRTLSLPRTGQALAIDLADKDNPGDIHPKNKQDVGHRLALLALNREYGQKTIDSGPVFTSMSVQGNKARLSFTNADGLKFNGEKPQGFALAGADGVFKWADATLENGQIVLSNPEIAAPVAVRYDWASNPIGNLYNSADLPMAPFRTDVGAEK